MNRWNLSDEVKEKYTPIVQEFIDNSTESINFSNTELNPYTLCKLLETLGYIETDQDSNGWQFDFWITMIKSGFGKLSVEGCGITFELKLVLKEGY